MLDEFSNAVMTGKGLWEWGGGGVGQITKVVRLLRPVVSLLLLHLPNPHSRNTHTDFELAHQFSDTSNPPQGRNVEIVGTPMYIAPEVGKQEVVDLQKNDIWSLGVIAWEVSIL